MCRGGVQVGSHPDKSHRPRDISPSQSGRPLTLHRLSAVSQTPNIPGPAKASSWFQTSPRRTHPPWVHRPLFLLMAAAGPTPDSRATAASAAPATTTRPDPKGLPQGLAPEARKRTNSLGWAHSDCHTCAADHFVCDRRRPRCDSCTTRGLLCGGYVQVLNWQPGVASRGKMKGRQLKVETSPLLDNGRNDVVKPVAFLFVHEQGLGERIPAKRRKSRAQHSNAPDSTASTPVVERRRAIQSCMPPLELPPPARNDSDDKTVTSPVPPAREDGRVPLKLPWPMGSLYPVSHKVGELLSFYVWQFARTTITCDVKMNPWQCSIPMAYDTLCLMNAVTALSWRHRAHCLNSSEGQEVTVMKCRALALFRAGMQTIPCEALIATTLALIGLEVCSLPSAYLEFVLRLFLTGYVSSSSTQKQASQTGTSISRAHTKS